LERYIDACSTLQPACLRKYGTNTAAELSSSVTRELELVETYRDMLTRAQVSVQRAKNNLKSVPISSLPAEVITYIFHLVLAQQPCPLRVPKHQASMKSLRLPKCPDILSHICSQWRQIALASHGLWSHVDIALSCNLSKGLHERAVTHVARAHQMPLGIHFVDIGLTRKVEISVAPDERETINSGGEFDELMRNYNPQEFTFLTSSSRPWVRSLGLAVHHRYHPIHDRALDYCLVNCLPRGLSELIINVPNAPFNDPSFFEPVLDPQNQIDESSTQLSLSQQQLESAWHPTTTLVLNGRYPHWNSTAYYGLTELRLLGSRRIFNLDLVGVLQASPGLRIIRCDF